MRHSRLRGWYALVAVVVFIIGTNVHDVLRYVGLRRFFQSWIVNGLANTLQILLCVFGLSLHTKSASRARFVN